MIKSILRFAFKNLLRISQNRAYLSAHKPATFEAMRVLYTPPATLNFIGPLYDTYVRLLHENAFFIVFMSYCLCMTLGLHIVEYIFAAIILDVHSDSAVNSSTGAAL